jgi:hypothetical protein
LPNRIIKESICTSDTLAQLSWFEQCVFFRLIVLADDYGRYDARPAIISGRGFPLFNLTENQIADALCHLSDVGIIDIYQTRGRPYLQLKTWSMHQSIRAKKSRYPGPEMSHPENNCTHMKTSASNCMQVQADFPVIQSNPIQSESNPIQSTALPRTKPTVEEIAEYISYRKSNVNAQEFYDYYEARGWMSGTTPITDWKAACRAAEKWNRWSRPAGPQAAAQHHDDELTQFERDAIDKMMKKGLYDV